MVNWEIKSGLGRGLFHGSIQFGLQTDDPASHAVTFGSYEAPPHAHLEAKCWHRHGLVFGMRLTWLGKCTYETCDRLCDLRGRADVLRNLRLVINLVRHPVAATAATYRIYRPPCKSGPFSCWSSEFKRSVILQVLTKVSEKLSTFTFREERVWSGFIWLRIGTSNGLFWAR
jgi:hypothetical protein